MNARVNHAAVQSAVQSWDMASLPGMDWPV